MSGERKTGDAALVEVDVEDARCPDVAIPLEAVSRSMQLGFDLYAVEVVGSFERIEWRGLRKRTERG